MIRQRVEIDSEGDGRDFAGLGAALAGSSKSEARMRDRADLAFWVASSVGPRAVATEVDCTLATASRWRVRCVSDRMAGLNDAGGRGWRRPRDVRRRCGASMEMGCKETIYRSRNAGRTNTAISRNPV